MSGVSLVVLDLVVLVLVLSAWDFILLLGLLHRIPCLLRHVLHFDCLSILNLHHESLGGIHLLAAALLHQAETSSKTLVVDNVVFEPTFEPWENIESLSLLLPMLRLVLSWGDYLEGYAILAFLRSWSKLAVRLWVEWIWKLGSVGYYVLKTFYELKITRHLPPSIKSHSLVNLSRGINLLLRWLNDRGSWLQSPCGHICRVLSSLVTMVAIIGVVGQAHLEEDRQLILLSNFQLETVVAGYEFVAGFEATWEIAYILYPFLLEDVHDGHQQFLMELFDAQVFPLCVLEGAMAQRLEVLVLSFTQAKQAYVVLPLLLG